MPVMTGKMGQPAGRARAVIIPSPRIGVVELLAALAGGATRLGRWWWRYWQDYLSAGRGGSAPASSGSVTPSRKAAA